jgi:hypothetical protein
VQGDDTPRSPLTAPDAKSKQLSKEKQKTEGSQSAKTNPLHKPRVGRLPDKKNGARGLASLLPGSGVIYI